jgi:hypothetical protein
MRALDGAPSASQSKSPMPDTTGHTRAGWQVDAMQQQGALLGIRRGGEGDDAHAQPAQPFRLAPRLARLSPQPWLLRSARPIF